MRIRDVIARSGVCGFVLLAGGCGHVARDAEPYSRGWPERQCEPVLEWVSSVPPPECRYRVPREALIAVPVNEYVLERSSRRSETLYSREFVGDLRVAIGTDEPDGFRYASRRTLASLGLDEDALWRVAFGNIDERVASASIEPYWPGMFSVKSDDLLRTGGLALSDSLWKRSEFRSFKGPPIVLFDASGDLLVADSADDRGIASLLEYRDGVIRYCDSITSCSPAGHLFVRQPNGRWRVWQGEGKTAQ
jgi:hypothetical protein